MKKVSKLTLLALTSGFVLAGCGVNSPADGAKSYGWAQWPSSQPQASQPASEESSWDYLPPEHSSASSSSQGRRSSRTNSTGAQSTNVNDWKDEDAPWLEEYPEGSLSTPKPAKWTLAKFCELIYTGIIVDGLGSPNTWSTYLSGNGNTIYNNFGYYYTGINFGAQELSLNMFYSAALTVADMIPEDMVEQVGSYHIGAQNSSVYINFADESGTLGLTLEGTASGSNLVCYVNFGYVDALSADYDF